MPRLVAAALLVVAGGLAVGGSFGAFSVFTFGSAETTTRTNTTGWSFAIESTTPVSRETAAALYGIPLTVGAVLAIAGAVLLVLSARRAGASTESRLLGVAGAAVLCGTVAAVWVGLIASIRNATLTSETLGPDADFQQSAEAGTGAWLELGAGIVALVAIGLLFVPVREVVGQAQGQFGMGPGYPQGPGAPNWPPPPNPAAQYPGQYPEPQHPGQQYPGGQHPGRQHQGQQYPRQQHPGQQYPGQPHPGQQYPARQSPGQHPGSGHFQPGPYPGTPDQGTPDQGTPDQGAPDQGGPNQGGQNPQEPPPGWGGPPAGGPPRGA